ncbi:MAG: hydrogenase maturation nickel metallochaperone HypA [Methylomicrobium sp.]
MHELSLCEDLLDQVKQLAESHRAQRVVGITVQIGVLSGVEPKLLASAFEINRIGTIAGNAQLTLETLPARVFCNECLHESEVPGNQLGCPLCGCLKTRLTTGDEMILARVEMDTLPDCALSDSDV